MDAANPPVGCAFWTALFSLADMPDPKWYRPRGYPHMDRRLAVDEASALVTTPARVASHSWLPLIYFRRIERRRKKNGKGFKLKKRPLAFASHADAHIFAYYCHQLMPRLEREIGLRGLGDVVLAYRKHQGGKTNFHFAAEVFAEIVARGECDVITMDIEKFFDTVPHRELKDAWKRLLAADELPPDHYAVFKAAAKFATVSKPALVAALGLSRRAPGRDRRLSCTPKEFREKVRGAGLVQVNSNDGGIPQGLPISGLLANMVMLEFDTVVNAAAVSQRCTYRRYSDDIILIGPPAGTCAVELLIMERIKALGMNVQPAKTTRSSFRKDSVAIPRTETPVQYLGFTFDGIKARLRPQTVVKYNKRLRKAVRDSAIAAAKATPKGMPIRIRRRKLYSQFSHLGPDDFLKGCKDLPRGSFYGYVRNAQGVFDRDETAALLLADIKRQLRRYWSRLQKLLKSAESSIVGTSD